MLSCQCFGVTHSMHLKERWKGSPPRGGHGRCAVTLIGADKLKVPEEGGSMAVVGRKMFWQGKASV